MRIQRTFRASDGETRSSCFAQHSFSNAMYA